jgi:NTP pyrophosphatase (non-canonical NTP hydrolase)
MNFNDLRRDAEELLSLRPDGYTSHPLHTLAKLTEEVGEVAECLVKSHKTKEDLGEELSDVMIVVAVLAVLNDIDLNDVCVKKQIKRVNKIVKRFHNGVYPND